MEIPGRRRSRLSSKSQRIIFSMLDEKIKGNHSREFSVRKRRCQTRCVLYFRSFSPSMLSLGHRTWITNAAPRYARVIFRWKEWRARGKRVTREQHSSNLHKRAFKLYKFDSSRNFENSFRYFCSASRVLRRINSLVCATLYFGIDRFNACVCALSHLSRKSLCRTS